MAEYRREEHSEETHWDSDRDPNTGEIIRRDPGTGEVVSHTTVHSDVLPPQARGHTYQTETYSADPYAYRRMQVGKVQEGIYLLFGILEVLLGIRFVLKVLAANPSAGFAQFVYGITAPFMAPFVGLFGEPRLGGSVFEWTSLVAIIVYALIAWALAKLVWIAAGENRSGVTSSRVDTHIDH